MRFFTWCAACQFTRESVIEMPVIGSISNLWTLHAGANGTTLVI
jgi:hypothetical protein